MDRIVATLKPESIGSQVANLQEALQLLLDRGVIRTADPPNSPTAGELAKLKEGLAKERDQSVYGKVTQRLVLYFHLQEGLGDGLGGAVEDKTAAHLNKLLNGLGALDAAPEWVVRGTVRDANGNVLPGLIVL